MTINGKKYVLRKPIRRALEVLEFTAVMACLIYCMVILFFFMIGIDLI